MRNHDIVVLLLLRVSFFILYVFILVYETAKWYKSSHDKKQYHQLFWVKAFYVTVRIGVRHGLYGGILKCHQLSADLFDVL